MGVTGLEPEVLDLHCIKSFYGSRGSCMQFDESSKMKKET